MAEEYASLPPELRDRLDTAELAVARTRAWVSLMADRGPEAHLVARELCLVLGWTPPEPGSPLCLRCGAPGNIHNPY